MLHNPKISRVLMSLVAVSLLSLALVACGEDTATPAPPATTAAASGATGQGGPPPVTGTPVKTASGLQYIDFVPGTGAEVKKGSTVTVHYTGYLANGKKFDSSLDRGKPYPITIPGNVIEGWNEGIPGMKVGGKRRLIIPAALGYGASGYPPVIPGNAELIFDIELLSVK